MRIPTPIQALSATALVLLAGCSGGSTIAPKSFTPQSHMRSLMGRIPAAVSPIGMLKVNMRTGNHFKSFNACPAIGPLTYISDFNNSVIDIYLGPFANQAPCAVLTSVNGLVNPQGMFVRMPSRRLYVANTGANNVVVYPRGGSLAPIQTLIDPTGQYPVDVTVASDGTVIASNIFSTVGAAGSISTWHTNGAFVGNFPMVNDLEGLFVTVQALGLRLFYSDIDATSGAGVVYKGSCPAGACGAFLPTPATTNTVFPGGLRSRNADTRLIQFDQSAGPGGVRLRYNDTIPPFPPNLPCNINGGDPVGFDMNGPANTIFYADAALNVGAEMTFNCLPIGVPVVGNAGGLPIGAAHDIPEPL
jgi:hypothetical protein